MKKWLYLSCLLVFLFAAILFVDRQVCVKKRILQHHLWEYKDGDRIRPGDFIDTKHAYLSGDTIVFDYNTPISDTIAGMTLCVKGATDNTRIIEKINDIVKIGEPYEDEYISYQRDTAVYEYKGGQGMDTLIIKCQYFNVMKLQDPKTGKIARYSMKGVGWVHYLFK